MAKNLVIVESPAKAKTIEGYLGKDFVVKSSYGHVRDLAKKGIAIDIENNFQPNYEVSPDKKQIVAELIKLAKEAEVVWLATDEDREGEAISWHLYESLNLAKKETKRITFNEITKSAITKAIENPRKINQELVNAQQARRILDRLVGFELSPVLWKKVRPSLSAGRVQSVAVRLIVDREKEINLHNSESYFRVNAIFSKGKDRIKAELNHQLKDNKEVKSFLDKCNSTDFEVLDVTQKPATKTPASPFTTSTLQQEASLKLGFSVTRTMSVAQRLYEAGKITYMRTDSVNLSETAIDGAQKEIISAYGKEYSKPTKYKTKDENAQEAHEAIRPTDFSMHSIEGESEEVRLYELIWKRSIASQMSHANLERTVIKIGSPKLEDVFQAKGEVIIFDGFLRVYLESKIDEDEDDEKETDTALLPAVTVGEGLGKDVIRATQRFSRAAPRYVEASLVKKLEELGIGRPSTYAPTITTIQKRGYVEKKENEGLERKYEYFELKNSAISEETKVEITGKEKNKLSPTDIGVVVTDFLTEHFDRILDYNFTAKVEAEFDQIAKGLVEWTKMIHDFYTPFHLSVEHTLEHSERASGERELGFHPESGKRIIVRIGRFGPMAQIGEENIEEGEKPQFASLQKNQSIGSITLEEVLELFKLPRTLGEFEELVLKANVGRFGPYLQHGKAFVSLPKEDSPMSVDLDRAIEIILEKRQSDIDKIIKLFPENTEVRLLIGRWGPFLKIGKDNFKLPKDIVVENLTLEECMHISENQPVSKFKKKAPAKVVTKVVAKKAPVKKAVVAKKPATKKK